LVKFLHDGRGKGVEMSITLNRSTVRSDYSFLRTFSVAIAFLAAANLQTMYGQSDTIQTTVPALKDVFAEDFNIGCLLSYRNIGFASDPAVPGQSTVITPNGGYLIKFHMNSMTPGNNMKAVYTVDLTGSASAYNAASTSQAKDSIDTHPIIRFNGDLIAQLNWAKRQGFTFRGHTLVWHSQTPGTGFFRTGYSSSGARLTKEKMMDRMENYIKEVIRLLHESWPGLLSAMDVVNEAVNDNGTDRTTDSEWYTTFGDNTYIMKAFEFARKYTTLYGETQMKLYYNDYNTYVPSKADGIVRLCGPIFRAGYLDGLGMQEHDGLSYPTASQWITTYSKYDTICTEMAVTELDVNTGSGTNSPSASVLAQQANQYGQLFKCFVERSYKSGRGKIISVSKDGLNDQYTFVTNQATSLWDTRNQCKPAFYAVANVGSNYNALDSLIRYAGSLTQGTYTTTSWSNFTTALSAARTARDQNYSVSVSADAALTKGKDDLTAAILGLTKTVSSVSGHTPAQFELSQNYPNPFNPATAISFQLPAPSGAEGSEVSFVSLKVFDALGKEVATLVNEEKPAGSHTVTWNALNSPSGVYFYRIVAGDHVDSKKMLLMK
jgi:endo-1,4-beta-xylanase